MSLVVRWAFLKQHLNFPIKCIRGRVSLELHEEDWMKRLKNYINGAWVSPDTTEYGDIWCPATGE